MVRRALMISGTGMLAGPAGALVADGWHVVLPSRRYVPITVEDGNGDTRRPTEPGGRQALWVAADWSNPADLAQRARKALSGKADLLVAWIYSEYRDDIMHAVEPLLNRGAPIVEVYTTSTLDPLGATPEPTLSHHPTQQVLVGFVHGSDGTTRRANHQEITRAINHAVDRALTGHGPELHQVGDLAAWIAHD
jgi:hypothetical protein